MAEPKFSREINQRSIHAHCSPVGSNRKGEMMQHPLPSRTNIALFQPGAKRVDLMRQHRHEALTYLGVIAECRKELSL